VPTGIEKCKLWTFCQVSDDGGIPFQIIIHGQALRRMGIFARKAMSVTTVEQQRLKPKNKNQNS